VRAIYFICNGAGTSIRQLWAPLT